LIRQTAIADPAEIKAVKIVEFMYFFLSQTWFAGYMFVQSRATTSIHPPPHKGDEGK
jgi:hypothetical protein